MKSNSKKIIIITLVAILLIGLSIAGIGYYLLFTPQFHPDKTTYIFIDRDDTADSILYKVESNGHPKSMTGFKLLAKHRGWGSPIRTGKYAIHPNDDARTLYTRLSRGYKEPINLTVGSTRTIDLLARSMSRQLMIDSTEIANQLNDTALQNKMGYDEKTIASLIVPDTYQVYWDVSAEDLVGRLIKEHQRFWNEDRLKKAEEIGLTPIEVSTLASIVDEETNNNVEKPIVAGLYINRLQRGIPLQADPTVKFAIGDFTLRRITNEHLKYESPYNTYLNAGLPPGPIRIPTKQGLESVLNRTEHDYIYMCAKEDLSGTHNFAVTYSEHMRNARKYWDALNKRKIYK